MSCQVLGESQGLQLHMKHVAPVASGEEGWITLVAHNPQQVYLSSPAVASGRVIGMELAPSRIYEIIGTQP